MDHDDAVALLRGAVPGAPGVWADFGAGTGTFTRALSTILGDTSTIYAVDADTNAVHALQALATSSEAQIVPIEADFTRLREMPSLAERAKTQLDGILLANSLHFVRDQVETLSRLATLVRSEGRVVVVEYDRREASQWVPYPIPAGQWPRLARAAGLVEPVIGARRPSMYSGALYVGYAITRPPRS